MNTNFLNNTISYIVKTGDSLYTIAKKYNTTVEELMKINHLSSSMIYPNQVLFIPSTCNINNDTYLTKECESINDILAKFNINYQTLVKYNDVLKLKLCANQLLKVRDSNLNSLTLSRNDSVDEILAKYQKSPYELLKLNEKEWFKENGKIIIGWLSFFLFFLML